ncbi:hypothetical protein IU498_32290 [Nocardia beijingensis]|uniref:aromatic prenyltransferase n=1 Tax=Nocardia beijingensis TaxID=95162 RepID=UPI001894B9BB|nr:aromatic prenyltransferase [Nocardia beijingensis]MBF6079309.1 hypothetical protein [Nocardia beijingensis]
MSSTSATVTLDRLRRDLREFARLARAGYDPAVVDPALEALADLWTGSVVGVRTTTHPDPDRKVNARVQHSGAPAELLETLREAGLITFTGHPMERLLTEVCAEVPAGSAVDLSLTGGVQKVWLFFADVLDVERMLAFPGIPDAARSHADHLTRYGGKIGILAVDFAGRTMNLYSQVLPPGTITSGDIATILTDLDFVAATDEELALFDGTFNVYRTFSWTSSRMRRICFPQRYQEANFPRDLDPVLTRFVDGAPRAFEGPRGFTLYAAYGPRSRYYKVQAEYTTVHAAAIPGGGAAPRAR